MTCGIGNFQFHVSQFSDAVMKVAMAHCRLCVKIKKENFKENKFEVLYIILCFL